MNVRSLVALVWGVILLFKTDASGQSFCGNTGGFTVTPTEGCAPLAVKVENTVPKSENISYAFNFDRKSTSAPGLNETTQETSFTYTAPGTYTILQFGSAAGTGFSQCKDVIVHETRAPKAEVISCPNGKVRLTLLKDDIAAAYDAIEINWGDGTKDRADLKNGTLIYNHTYSRATNLPNIQLRGIYGDGKCSQTTNVGTIASNTGPGTLAEIRIRSVEMSAGGDVKVIYDGLDDVPTELWIDQGDGQFTTTGKTSQSGGQLATTVTGLDPKKVYRFKLVSKNICDNLIDSPIVSTIVGEEGPLALDEIISLTWKQDPNTEANTTYQVLRDGTVVFSTNDEMSFLDTEVKCANTYQYQIVGIIDNDVRSYSAPFSLEPKSAAPETITRAGVTVLDESSVATAVELTGVGLTSSYNLIIERSALGSNNFKKISPEVNQSLQFTDNQANTSDKSYCYRFQYENACKLKAPDFSPPVCTILLTNKAPDIVWNSNAAFTDPLEGYYVQQLNAGGDINDAIPVQQATSFGIDLVSQSEFSYRIEAVSAGGAYKSYSNILRFTNNPILLVPDAFTPNGDGYNERFEVKAYFVTGFKMSVFDRWGSVVYHTESTDEGWDGKLNGQNAGGGYYTYRIEATDISGKPVVKNGSFLLIR